MLCLGCGTPNRAQAARCVRCGKALSPAPIAPSVARELKEQTNAKKPLPARPIVPVPSLGGLAERPNDPIADTTSSRSSPWSQSLAGGALRTTPLEDAEVTRVELSQAQSSGWKQADTEDEQPAIAKVGFTPPRGRPPPPKPSALPRKGAARDSGDTERSVDVLATADTINAAQSAAQKLTRTRVMTAGATQETLQEAKKANNSSLPSFPDRPAKAAAAAARSSAPTEELLKNRPVTISAKHAAQEDAHTPLAPLSPPPNAFDEPAMSATRLAAPGELAGRSDAGRSDAGRSDAGRSDAGRSDTARPRSANEKAASEKSGNETFAAPGELAGILRNAKSAADLPSVRSAPPAPPAPRPSLPSNTREPMTGAQHAIYRDPNPGVAQPAYRAPATAAQPPPSRSTREPMTGVAPPAQPPPSRSTREPMTGAAPPAARPPPRSTNPPPPAHDPLAPPRLPPPARTNANRTQPSSPEHTIAAPGELAGLIDDLGISKPSVPAHRPPPREPRRAQTSDLVAPWSAQPKIDLNAPAALPGPPALDLSLPMRTRTEPEGKQDSGAIRADITDPEVSAELSVERTPPPRLRGRMDDSLDDGLLSMPGSTVPHHTLMPLSHTPLLEGIDVMPNETTASLDEPAVVFELPSLLRRVLAEVIDIGVLGAIVIAPIAGGLFGKNLSSIAWMDPDDVSHALIGGAMLIPGIALAVLALVSSTLSHAYAGRSLGKLVCGLELVVRKTGRRPTLLRTAIRAGLGLVGSIAFGTSYLWLIVDRRSRTLHDVLTGTVAVVSSSRREL